MGEPIIGVMGGSGLYQVAGLEGAEWHSADTPWGAPSDALLHGVLDGTRMVFLPRHGRRHVHTPSSVPYRANVAALKSSGVTHLVSVSAVGSFRDAMAPGDFVVVDQFIDRTFAREKSFFGPGLVAHVSVAHPVCPALSTACADAARQAGANVHNGGTYLAMEGPQFSTLAESKLYREVWGCDVVGMTNMPEAKLAREAEIHYASVAMVTDYDSWHPDHGSVQITEILETLHGNAEKAAKLVAALPALVRDGCGDGCDRALDNAIMTAPEARSPDMVDKLAGIAGRVLKKDE